FDRIGRAATRLVQLTDNCLADARLASHDLHVERQQTALLTVINMAASVVAISFEVNPHVIHDCNNVHSQISRCRKPLPSRDDR
ncbi:hypothetical protein C7D74_32405, partial [Klebsiella pneumoniae]